MNRCAILAGGDVPDKDEYKESAVAKQTAEEVQKLKDQLAQMQNTLRQTEDQNQKMKQTLLAIKAEREKINARTIARNQQLQKQSDAIPAKDTATRKPAAAPKQGAAAVQPSTKGGTTYTVQPGDTLIKISRKCYGSQKHYRLIAEANSGKLGKNMQVRVGQVLNIPPLPKQ